MTNIDGKSFISDRISDSFFPYMFPQFIRISDIPQYTKVNQTIKVNPNLNGNRILYAYSVMKKIPGTLWRKNDAMRIP